jgi:hypothetical protein
MLPQMRAMAVQAASAMLPGAASVPLPAYSGAVASAAGAGYAPGVGGGAPAPSGNLIVNVDGKQLLAIAQSQLYEYNIRNSGQVTGVVKPS